MALIETLIQQIESEALRKAISREVAQLKKRLAWGLVFEQHIPETTLLLNAPIRPGVFVWERRSTRPRRFRVEEVQGDQLIVVQQENGTLGMGAPESVKRADVLIERTLGEPIYPALRSVGSERRGPADRPTHSVINGENYHALELLTLTHGGRVDVCYLDPPYNTGARDWRYNNRYVDDNDTYRHSKWLSMMEKRLRLCRKLLKPDGVIVVAIDEHEVFHLGMLLEQMFPEAMLQMATIVINPLGVERGGGMARIDEQALFVFFGAQRPLIGHGDDLYNARDEAERPRAVRWERLIRGGEGSGRGERGSATLFYPVLVDPEKRKVMGVGPVMLEGDPDPTAKVDGWDAVWPIRGDGSWGRWRIGRDKLMRLHDQGFVRVGESEPRRGSWSIQYVPGATIRLIDQGIVEISRRDDNGVAHLTYSGARPVVVKTVWSRQRHVAGNYGSHLLTSFLGGRGLFQFPKSLYAVKDLLEALLHDRPDAVIVDPFAGSGTTLHATLLLNAADGGRRQCFLITNNEVADETARRMSREGLFRGDRDFEAQGIFEAVTVPRVQAAITGQRGDGSDVPGDYLDGRPYAEGFAENAEFFELDYLDPLEVELGERFADLVPTLWLTAGGRGKRNGVERGTFAVPDAVPYAFLFDASGVRGLIEALEGRPDVATVFVQAATDEAFADLREQLPERVQAVKLYGAYVDHFRRAVR